MKGPFNDHEWRDRPDAQEQLGEFGSDIIGHPSIFPNLLVGLNGLQLGLRLPKGVNSTQIWWFTFVERREDSKPRAVVGMATHMFGPAGLLEQDDGENWNQSTRGTMGTVARRYPLSFTMGIGHGEIKRTPKDVRYIDSAYNEHAQLWTWRSWADWMNAPDWESLKRDRTPLPTECM
jgi:hypothetical protein